MFALDLKKSTAISFAGPLEYYIKHVYCENPEKFEMDISNLQGLRGAATSSEIDGKKVTSLLRYYCTLTDLQKKFIFDEDNVGRRGNVKNQLVHTYLFALFVVEVQFLLV